MTFAQGFRMAWAGWYVDAGMIGFLVGGACLVLMAASIVDALLYAIGKIFELFEKFEVLR